MSKLKTVKTEPDLPLVIIINQYMIKILKDIYDKELIRASKEDNIPSLKWLANKKHILTCHNRAVSVGN